MNLKQINSIQIIGIHLLVCFLLYFVLFCFDVFNAIPGIESLMRWDAGWYKSIVTNGYSYSADGQSNMAFYPLFPFVWKFLHLSPIGISILNLLFFISGILILRKTLIFNNATLLILLSTPSLFFCYVPYSEGLFFLSCSILLYGLRWNNKFAFLGLFLACLTRSASIIFIPLILISKLYNLDPKGKNRRLLIETGIMISVVLVSTFVAQYIQFVQTGEFFSLFNVQKHWFRIITLPEFPLTTWDGFRLIWLDGLAFFMSLISIYLIVRILVKKLKSMDKSISPIFLFSIGYIALVSLVSLFYSGKDASGGTSIFSLNRFVFSTPFFAMFLIFCFRYFKWRFQNTLLFCLIAIANWLLFKWSGFANRLFYYALIFSYSFLYVLISNKKFRKVIVPLIYFINILLQLYLFNNFLNGLWIG